MTLGRSVASGKVEGTCQSLGRLGTLIRDVGARWRLEIGEDQENAGEIYSMEILEWMARMHHAGDG